MEKTVEIGRRRDVSRSLAENDGISIAQIAATLKEIQQRQEQLFAMVQDETIGRRRNIQYLLEEQALRETAELVCADMVGVRHFSHPEATLRHALSLAPAGGLALEFGVYKGRTLNIIAEARADGHVYGFDSFEGLPQDWRPGFPAGTFATSKIPSVPGAQVVVGWFDTTLPRFLDAHPEPVDFVHIDCDLYSSTRTVLDLLASRLRHGSVLMFDEYFNYPGWREHEHKAWTEFAEQAGLTFQYECYTFNNEQLALRIVK